MPLENDRKQCQTGLYFFGKTSNIKVICCFIMCLCSESTQICCMCLDRRGGVAHHTRTGPDQWRTGSCHNHHTGGIYPQTAAKVIVFFMHKLGLYFLSFFFLVVLLLSTLHNWQVLACRCHGLWRAVIPKALWSPGVSWQMHLFFVKNSTKQTKGTSEDFW